MHKITLKFLDQSIEQKYQQEHQSPKRKTHLKLFLSLFYILSIIKLAIALIVKNYAQIYPTLVMMGCIALSKFFNFDKHYQQRTLIIYINICFTIFVLFFDLNTDAATMYLKGANQMTINIVNILGTEFIDSTITITILYSLRLVHLVQNSPLIDISTVILGLGANLAMIAMVYFYHKAIRSQFLLSKIDQRWENILKQILHNQKYILINYQIEKLQFQSLSSTFSESIQTQEEVINFIREAKVENKTLEQYIFHKLKEFSSNFVDIVNHQVNVKYDKQLIQVNFSIFFGNQPTVLIQTSQSKQISQNQETYKVCHLYLKLLTAFIKIIKENKPFDQKQFHNLANRIQYQDLMTSIWNKQISQKKISLKKSLVKIQTFCNPITKIQLVGSDQVIATIPKISTYCQPSLSIVQLMNQLPLNMRLQALKSIELNCRGSLIYKNQIIILQKLGFICCSSARKLMQNNFVFIFLSFQLGINLELNGEILQPFTNLIIPQQHAGFLIYK